MKYLFVLLFFVFCFLLTGWAQTDGETSFTDTALAKKITIAGVCLCRTTVSDLRNIDKDLQEVEVEEMDLCKGSSVQDMRFVNRKGYYSKKYPGMIFQKDQDNDFISKIRLTKDFVGRLPDGSPIDMKNFHTKDVMRLYPAYDNSWKSRGCSEYWNLTDDTLSFYVVIDKNKQPQFPIDRAYYGEKPVAGVDLVVSCYSIFRNAHPHIEKLFNDPVFFIDSINVTRIELQKYQPTDIAIVTVYKDTNAIRLVGEEGRDGVVYIETKAFARKRYWNFFRTRSADYQKTVPDPKSDSSVVYILNGKVLTTNFEADLALINETTFIGLDVIDRDRLQKDFGINDKKFGVLIRAKVIEKKKEP